MLKNKKKLLNTSILLWAIPTLAFINNPFHQDLTGAIILPLIFATISSFFNHKILLYNTPFVLLLTPLSFKYNIDVLNIGHLWVLFSFLNILLKFKYLFIIMKYFDVQLVALSFFIIVSSYIFNENYSVLLPGLINCFGLLIIFLNSRICINDNEDVLNVTKSLLYCNFYIAIIILWGFFNELNLNGFGQPLGYDNDGYKLTFFLSFFKGSYFFNNIFFILGASIIFSFVYLTSLKKTYERIFCYIIQLTILLSLMIFQNKTVIVSLFIVLVMYMTCIKRNLNIKDFSLITLISIACIFYGIHILSIYPNIINNLNLSSLEARALIVDNFFNIFLNDLRIFLFGMGPESSLRIPYSTNPIIKDLKMGVFDSFGASKIEGTLDSGHLSFAFEYGFLFLCAYHFSGLIMVWLILKKYIFQNSNYKKHNFYSEKIKAIAFLSFLLFTYLSGLTQVLGVSKVSYVLSYLLALWPVMYGYKKYSS